MTTLADTEDRRAALTDFQNNLVVVAGAGTGKTSLLVGRLAYALVRMRFEPSDVLALTFTDNAATEMRERLIRLLRAVEPWLAGDDVDNASDLHTLEALAFGPEDRSRVQEVLARADSLPLSTFHSFCTRLLTRHARELGLPPEQHTGDLESTRASYDAAFLQHLADQPRDEVHPALHRFDPKDLRDFGWELLKLPSDAVARCGKMVEPPTSKTELEVALKNVRELLSENPDVTEEYADCFASLVHGLESMLAGDLGAIPNDLPKKLTRGPGRGVKDKDLRHEIQRRTNETLELVSPYARADVEAVEIAVDFLREFLIDFHAAAMARGEMTYDDVVIQTRAHLLRSAKLRHAVGGSLKAVLVDEFQDTDPLLYDILFAICGKPLEGAVERPLELPLRKAILFIVGDPKQCIYRFRSADLAAFDVAATRIRESAEGGEQLSLITNFRCAPRIVDFVNHTCEVLLAARPPYQLDYEPIHAHTDPEHASVEWVTIEGTEDSRAHDRRVAEGHAVVQKIREFHATGVPYSEIAVLLRAASETNWLLRPLRASNIPYAIEGSRRFYQRHEVVVATALLGAIARPHDPVPVLGVLRSAFSGATDRQIFEFVREHGPFALDYRRKVLAEEETKHAAVGVTLARLRWMRSRARGLPVDRALEFLLTQDTWLVTEGSGYEGAQRLANLERMLRALVDSHPLDLTAAAEFAEQRTAGEIEDEESPLFDPDFDAVRIMTIHRSKGLEYDAVILPDLARQLSWRDQPERDAVVQRAFGSDGRELVGARLGGRRNVANLLLLKENQRHWEAEENRLFYVAATRAKRHLTVLCSEKAPASSIQRKITDIGDLSESVDTRLLEPRHADDTDDATADRELIAAETLAAWRAHDQLLSRLVTHVDADERPNSPTAEFVPPPDRDYHAADLGIAIHRYLAIVDLDRDAVDSDLVDSVVEDDGYREELVAMARCFHESELARRTRSAVAVRREVPIAFVDHHGETQSRIVDMLLVEDGDAGTCYTVLDHKSDRVTQGEHEHVAKRYEEQLARYAEGVQCALGLETAPTCVVHFVRDARLVPVSSA